MSETTRGKTINRFSVTGHKRQIIYVSPLPYDSFSQRPHKFVHWFHSRTGGAALWLNPYPTRLPRWADLRQSRTLDRFGSAPEPWLKVVSVRGLPIEPLPGGTAINHAIWRDTFPVIHSFAEQGDTILVIGKPSAFAKALLSQFSDYASVYDMMDNFSAFYDGLSSRTIRRNEASIVKRVGTVLCSSTRLLKTTRSSRPDAKLVLNALDADMLLPASPQAAPTRHVGQRRIFGYVGTIAQWFDWNLIRALAEVRPLDTVRIIGPLFNPPPFDLPANVELKPAVRHKEALEQMQQFDVALIPFKENPLTACVDPIKYYEYRAMGLPIITTAFGEMGERRHEEGVFLFAELNLATISEQALAFRMGPKERARFIADNTWDSRFDRAGLLLSS